MGLPSSKADLPPMMVRYVEYKERYPDAILFFQVGDFYELFFDDAVTVSRALNLTLTSRDKNNPNPIPMCGIPLAVIDSYVDRLLPLGHSVAIVTQTGSGQGVDRALERFVTPGMRLFTTVNSDSSESLIAAVSVDHGPGSASVTGATGLVDAAIAYSDPQTGVVYVRDGFDRAVLGRELANLMAREIVAPRTIANEKIDRRTSWVRGIEAAVGSGAVRFRAEARGALAGVSPAGSSDELQAQGLTPAAKLQLASLAPAAKRAVQQLLEYLDEISLGNTIPIQEIRVARDAGTMVIDSATRRNLELVQNARDGSISGTLFSYLNCCSTPGGARMLRRWLLAPLCDVSAVQARLDGVRFFTRSTGVKAALEGMADLERLAARIQLNLASARDFAAVRDTLDRVNQLRGAVRPSLRAEASPSRSGEARSGRVKDGEVANEDNSIPPIPSLVEECLSKLEVPDEFLSLLTRALVDSPPPTIADGGVFREGFDTSLDDIRRVRFEADTWREQFETRERNATGISTLRVKSNNVIGYFMEITATHASKVPSHYVRRQSTANAERFTTPELKTHEQEVITAVDRQIRREQELLNELKAEAVKYVEVLRLIAGAISCVDTLVSLAHVATRDSLVEPKVRDDSVLGIEKGRHPIIASLLQGRFIPNSLSIAGAAASTERIEIPSCFLVTGPNMGGKSTYLRQAAIITIMAQIGSFVPAVSATVGIADRVFARLGASDDLHEGESTFMVEMREAAHILAAATERSLVLIDELGRGTATSDGLALAHAILERLVENIGCRTLFATHYHELTYLGESGGRIGNLSVGSIEDGDQVVFTHEIRTGPAPKSYGIEVAKLSGLPSDVIKRATALLAAEGSATAHTSQQRGTSNDATPTAQLSMFGPPPSTRATEGQVVVSESDRQKLKYATEIQQLLSNVTVDSTTPRDALAILYRLSDMHRSLMCLLAALFITSAHVFGCAFLIIGDVTAESRVGHEQAATSASTKLRAEYTRLRNIDPATEDEATRPLWRQLAADMVRFIEQGDDAEIPPRIRLDAANVLGRLAKIEHRSGDARRAISLLTPLVESTRVDIESELRRSALVLRGDLAVLVGEPRRSIDEWYRAATSIHANAGAEEDNETGAGALARDTALLIQSRRQSLRNGTFDAFIPASELAVQRILPSSERRNTRTLITVVLDPGHGGDDSGAISLGGAHKEKELTMEVARRVRVLLERQRGVRVLLTRDRDQFVPLARRTAMANELDATVFVSLHVNASPTHDLHGLETYYLDNTDDQASRKLAERENGVAPGGSVDDLSFILSDLIQSGKITESIRLSRSLDDSLKHRVVQTDVSARSLGVKRGPFFVLVGAHMPCALVEMFFVDNGGDVKLIGSPAVRERLAVAISEGILHFVRGDAQEMLARPVSVSPQRKTSARPGVRDRAKNTAKAEKIR